MNEITSSRFFTPYNSVRAINEDRYKHVQLLIDAAMAFSRSTNQSVYIIDYFKQGFIYVSNSLAFLCGEDVDKIREFGYELYLRHVPKEEQKMLLEINEKGFTKFESIPFNERCDYTISYDFNITCGRKKTLINHKLTPLILNEDGRIWLALCTMSPSARKEPGHIMLRRQKSSTYFRYDLETHRWCEEKEIALSEVERNILLLSARGYTMVQIANQVCKSIDTIKTYKRNIFNRFDVTSIVEALTYATNYGLI